jgi:NADH dehydrogenase
MMRILIVGAGFAGMYAALAAARLRDEQSVSGDTLKIAVASPEPRLVIRPRLYEPAPETMVAPLAGVFDAVDVRYEQGRVDVIDSAGKSVVIVGPDGARRSLAAGSRGFKPDIPGLAQYGFSVDQIEDLVDADLGESGVR